MRRFVTPADINGTGRIVQWDGVDQTGPDAGADQWGRVEFSSYFRPPGLPGLITPTQPAMPRPLDAPVIASPWTVPKPIRPRMVTNRWPATPMTYPRRHQ